MKRGLCYRFSNLYKCTFFQDSDGDLIGQEACAAEIDALNSNNIPTHQCPLYATGSCYTASSTHKDYNDAEGNSYIQEEFRGCTPFEQKARDLQIKTVGLNWPGLR